MEKPKNFAIIGVGGYIAPRHLKAINETGNRLIAALDCNDSVGILDSYSHEAKFFTEFERFDRFAEKLKRGPEEERIHFVSICSPNYLHDAHVRFTLRIGANAICEKPVVINPWNLDQLSRMEQETGKKVYTVLQLRLHPSIIALKEKIDREYSGKKYNIVLSYITPRGPWYTQSWKGNISKSGGISVNIGIHFFDMLLWIFGNVKKIKVHISNPKKMAGYLELEKAKIKWFLSTDRNDLPHITDKARRILSINNEIVDFSDGFKDLHTKVYEEIMKGNGFRIKDAKPAISLVYKIRNTEIEKNPEHYHPFVQKYIEMERENSKNKE